MKVGTWVSVGLFDPSSTEDWDLQNVSSIRLILLGKNISLTSSTLVVANDLVSFRKQKGFHDGEDFVLDRGTTQDSCAFLSCMNEHLVMTYNISCPSFLRQSGSLYSHTACMEVTGIGIT